jgi:hypothetical protein
MKTVRQLADEIGVTKQAVWQKIKKEPLSTDLQSFTTRAGRTVYINEQGELLVKTAFIQFFNENVVKNDKQVDEKNVNENEQIDNEHQRVDEMFLLLQGELERKNKLIESQSRQLENKDKQIGELTAALENTTASLHAAQALHAGTMHKHLGAGAGDLQQEDAAELAHPEPEKKPGLFARIFGTH